MIRSNYYEDNPDLQRHVDAFIDWNEIVELYEDGFRDAKEYDESGDERLAFAPRSVEEAVEYYKQILDGYGDLSGKEISQIAQDMDSQGLKFENGQVTHPPEFEELFVKFQDAGLHPVGFERKYGGLGLPHIVKALAFEIAYRADTAFSIAAGSVNLAAIMEMYASPEMCEKWLPKLIGEKYTVTMGLSEPDFGSDLPNVRTTAERSGDQWLLTGTKRFQTMACGVNGHPSALLILARTGGPESGARGLSFFLVEGQHVEVTGLEKKLGLKASATCEVAFEKAPGHLIGEEGHGLSRYVIGMLNGARMSVASQGTGMATAAYYEARKYASERIQFGKPIAEIPAVKRMLRRMEREIAGMRALMIEAATSVDRYHWRALRMKEAQTPEREIRSDAQIRKWEKFANVITPMSKYYISEMCNSLIYDALQVFGGSGYCEEYDVARLYRDARITNIYDGTTQIQVNAAIGGITAGMSAKGNFREYLDQMFEKIPVSALLPELRANFEQTVEAYKGLPNAETKGELSFEVVHSATRLVIGLLLEKTAQKLEGEARAERLQLAHEYNVDSEAILAGNLIRMRRAVDPAAKPVAVAG
ncbi:MAG: acyl-CoA dehydrogenase family protein [bacterium]|nr:acyl-CoA dehydrogenase family protein [bacterium]